MLWLVVCGLVAMMASCDGDRLVVTTKQGKISGLKQTSTKGRHFYAFQSIPYAMPPVGRLRLRDPVAAEAWEGVRDGGPHPPMCPQFPLFGDPVYTGEEDCLYLSVYTPKPGDEDAALPVMVYIFGGAFRHGTASHYTGEVLLNHDVVLVIVQYRIGALGWLSTEDSIIPGNFGLKDQTLALRWVQANIRSFGGDPTKVTLFGHSSGAMCIHAHILSPHSRGLFIRAILQSGTLLNSHMLTRSQRELAYSTGRFLGCPHTRGMRNDRASQSLLTCLQNIDVKNLTLSELNYLMYPFATLRYGPRVDGDFLPDEPAVMMSEGRYNLVDLMSGVAEHEGAMEVYQLFDNEDMQWSLFNNFDVQAPDFLQLSQGPFPSQLDHQFFEHYVGGVKIREEDADKICKMAGDVQFMFDQEQVNILHVKNTAPTRNTFYYIFRHLGQRTLLGRPPLFERPSTGIGRNWVAHADECFLLFNVSIWLTLEREDDLRMRDIITTLWTNFAATGNPTPDGSLGFVWEPTSPGNLQHLALTLHPKMEPDTNQETRAFLESLLTRTNLLLHPDKVIYRRQPLHPAQHSEVDSAQSDPGHHHHNDL